MIRIGTLTYSSMNSSSIIMMIEYKINSTIAAVNLQVSNFQTFKSQLLHEGVG